MNQLLHVQYDLKLVPCRFFQHNFVFLDQNHELPFEDYRWTTMMPHPDRLASPGEPLYVSFLDVFGDDASGNSSKQWNVHYNLYFTHRNLPNRASSRRFNVHIKSSARKDMPISVQLGCLRGIINSTIDSPFRVFDSASRKVVRLQLALLKFTADNPMAADVCNHVGSNGNLYCRKCFIGDHAFVFVYEAGTQSTIPAKIRGLSMSNAGPTVATELFTLHQNRDQLFGLPMIPLQNRCLTVSLGDILFDFNVQTAPSPQKFYVNLFSSHNIHNLLDSLPKYLTSPSPLPPPHDGTLVHNQRAAKLRSSQGSRKEFRTLARTAAQQAQMSSIVSIHSMLND